MGAERRARVVLVALLGLLACASAPPAETVPTGRLPADTRPIAYRLELEIDPGRTRFSGRVEIDFELDRARTTVWLHALDLEIAEARVLRPDGESVLAWLEEMDPSGVAALRLAEAVGPGRATLSFKWEAPFAPGLRGLYRVERAGVAYAFTQMEPIDARRAFPGFDEPGFKVPFDVRLVVPKGMVALANTPELERQMLEGDRVRHVYARTPPLPTYLLAWAVGPFDVVEGPPIPASALRGRSIALRGIAPQGRGERLGLALSATPGILAAVEEWTGSGYPFAKLDIVAVPDFSAGAMENPGLVTFRDGLLLIDPETATVGQRRAFASVMAHELVHMWFGNLVTMPWWNDIWLNEAFATWLASKTIEGLHPEHHGDWYRVQSKHAAMQADARAAARRIREPIRSTHDIRSAFDPITYQKGAAVLAMFEAAAGEEAFRDAVRRYLHRHAWATATSDDFLAVIEEGLGAPFAEAMRGFLDQSGVPMLSIEPRCLARAGGDGEVLEWRVEQSRYAPLGAELDGSRSWRVPLCSDSGAGCGWAGAPVSVMRMGHCRPWIHPNRGATGYYRWSLPADDLQVLLTRGWTDLSVPERLSVADALLAGYGSGALRADEVLAAFAELALDPARPVATAPLDLLREARLHLATTFDERAAVERYVRTLYGARVRSLGFDDAPADDGERRLLRGSLVGAVVVHGRDGALRAEARRRGRRHLLAPPGEPDPAAASSELLGLVARVAVEDGGEEEFEAARGHLFASEDPMVRGRMLHALAFAREAALVERARSLVFESRLRSNERMIVLATQASRADRLAEREAVLAWVREREEAIVEAITLPRAAGLLSAASGFCSYAAADAIEDWLGDRIDRFPAGPRRLANLLEQTRLCAARVEQQRESARAFFSREETS